MIDLQKHFGKVPEFRFWDTDFKRFSRNDEHLFIICGNICQIDDSRKIGFRVLNGIIATQKTNLVDRLGNELWEGDIISRYKGKDCEDIKYFIGIDSCKNFDVMGSIKVGEEELGVWMMGSPADYEKIGNVFEHSQLLNE